VKQQMRERFAAQGDLHLFDLGEVAETDFAGLIRQREHHLRRRAMESLPVLHPPLQGAFERTPVLIRHLLLQVLQQGGGCQGRMALQQGQHQRLPYLGQRVWPPPSTGFRSFGLDSAVINPVSTAHRDARRSGSHLPAAAGPSFGNVERNLLSGEGSRHDPVPSAWHRIQLTPPERSTCLARLLNQIVVGYVVGGIELEIHIPH